MRRNQSPESMLAEIMWNEFSVMGHLEHESGECEFCAWTRKMATRGAEIILARLAEERIELVSRDAADRMALCRWCGDPASEHGPAYGKPVHGGIGACEWDMQSTLFTSADRMGRASG